MPRTSDGSSQPMIVMEGVEKWYSDFKALTNINLTVRAGEKIVLCGPSGSGKSTLIRCINHLESYQKGRIVVDGVHLDDKQKTIDSVRREVGMVFQQFNLFPHLTVLENCTLAPIRARGVDRTQAEATARRLLERVRVSDQAGKYPAQLSGGQQQRVAIARALCMEPKAMLFD
ncbi:MAG: amino acid ABC transporter ATP-binding protein, partial [Pseudolabrys sp.]